MGEQQAKANRQRERQKERQDWEAVLQAWQQTLKCLDVLDVLLREVGERDLAQQLLEFSYPMSVRFVYAAAQHGVRPA